MKKLFTLAFMATTISANAEHAHHHLHDHTDHKAPIGVMGAHTHEEGEFMFSYRYSKMWMKGNRDGSDQITPAQVIADPNFTIAPLDMEMDMHMFGAMYGYSDDVTIMAMAPYVRKVMGHVTGGGAHFTTETQGLGDTKLSALYSYDDKMHFTLGFSLPTGATNEYDTVPLGVRKLPYPMQLGSGTFDPILGVTYQDHCKWFSWGTQANATLRLYDNDDDYHLGNEYGATIWAAKPLSEIVTGSLRLDAKAWNDISGRDSQIALPVPTAFTDLRGGRRADLLIGLSFTPKEFAAPIDVEFGIPVYQHLDGPQLETDYRLVFGSQYIF